MENSDSIPLQKKINQFLKEMLAKGCIDALLVPQKDSLGNIVVQSLVSTPEKMESADPISPVMPVNSGTIVSKMTKLTPSKRKVGVVLKPCETRALIELMKLKQASLENIVLIGIDCLGTFSVKDFKEMVSKGKSPIQELLGSAEKGEAHTELREACRVCEWPVHEEVDITIGIYGGDFETPIFIANTEVGKEILEKLGVETPDDLSSRNDTVTELMEKRKKAWEDAFEVTLKEIHGIEKLLTFLSSCINCHNCMKVCPVCYCKECFFESPTFEYGSEKYMRWADKKGRIKMPTDSLLFHLTRLNHMVLSCVACGMCEQACPSEIPLLRLFKAVGQNAQEEFDYIPGKSVDDPLPLITFKEEEFEPR